MFSAESMEGAIGVLKLGVIGLGFILALMAFVLLAREQKKSEPHANIIRAIYTFMVFAVVLSGLGLYAQMGNTSTGHASSNLEEALSALQISLKNKDEQIDDLEQNAQALSNELTKIRTTRINWDYKPNGPMFTCSVNGRKVGVPLDCRNHDSCNNRQLNRGICALRYSDQIW